MFFNRNKLKKDASDLFNQNIGFNTELFNTNDNINKNIGNENKNNKNNKVVDEDTEAWAQWWNVNPEVGTRVEWKLSEKIILGLEVLMIIYFVLWYLGLVPIF